MFSLIDVMLKIYNIVFESSDREYGMSFREKIDWLALGTILLGFSQIACYRRGG